MEHTKKYTVNQVIEHKQLFIILPIVGRFWALKRDGAKKSSMRKKAAEGQFSIQKASEEIDNLGEI
jgi:hypothetical protein